MFKDKVILFLGCHLDDVEFGCGGTIANLVRNRQCKSIHIFVLSKFNHDSEGNITIERRLDEPYQAIECLGMPAHCLEIGEIPGQRFQDHEQKIREELLKKRDEINPDIVFFPSRNDIHQDHYALSNEAFRIFRNNTCLGYEIIRSCYHFSPNMYYGISDDDLQKKINAIMCYKSQLTQSAAYYIDPEIIKSISVFRGGQCGKKLAEAFEIYAYHYN